MSEPVRPACEEDTNDSIASATDHSKMLPQQVSLMVSYAVQYGRLERVVYRGECN